MALAQLASRLSASRLSFACRNAVARAPVQVLPCAFARLSSRAAPPPPPSGGRGGPAHAAPPNKKSAPPAKRVEEFDEDEFEDDHSIMDSLTAAEKRRVHKLDEVQQKYDKLYQQYNREVAQLQDKYFKLAAPIFDERKAIVTGAAPVDKYDIEDDGEPDNGVPSFWLQAFMNHDEVGPYITERDAEVLSSLEDVRCEVLTGANRGFKLFFHFKPNKYFSNTVLEKGYVLDAEDDLAPQQLTGTAISWAPGMDVTHEQVKKRVKGKGKDGKPAYVVEKEPCDSFFNFFDPVKVPTKEELAKMQPEQLEDVQTQLAEDFDMGHAIKDQIIPQALGWFTGELADYDSEDDYDEYEDEEEFEEPPPPPPKRR